ncbi:hypothetical protein [Maribacter halichondriae]|uniref:hypothetical protein n=1 Tax=Maribacter halichondriae TaxID=2980554 RepID=UPI0023581471|nr:hypothetical protein [Maribacter sp. Hal144]
MRILNLMSLFAVIVTCAQGNIHAQGEGGIFTASRLAALKTGEGGLGNNPSTMNLYSDMRMKFAKMGEEVTLTLDDIEGTIYLNDKFNLGTLAYDGQAFKKLHMRYDAYNDEVEIKESAATEEVLALVKDPELSCSLNGSTFIFTRMIDANSNERSGYLIPLYEGKKYSLYERRLKEFKEGKPAKTSHSTSFPHRFVDAAEYYVKIREGIPGFVKAKKNDLMVVFGKEREKHIKEYIKDKRINLNNQVDLIDLFAFANTL